MISRKQRHHNGFTMIELLLSLAIFAMLGMATYSVLNNTIRGKEVIESQTAKLVALQRGMMFIENDLRQVAQRKVRISGEAPTDQFFVAQPYLFDSDDMGFAFVRDGWTNPAMMLPRSEMQVVAYRIKETRLERLYFNFVDADVGTEPRVQIILDDISELELAFWFIGDEDGEWQTDIEDKALPTLVKLSLVSKVFGKLERVFELIEVTEPVDASSGAVTTPTPNGSRALDSAEGDND